ncbi:MAG: phosphoribosylaminoimidazolesuccinocarboxamide synthase [Thermodesulfobacteriota bacterium]|nr:phosphoribosylaminoimidazolesuccinocarboxamide synthase [Thermodesulfobacteriota bacterium]
MQKTTIYETNFPGISLKARGKVRDIYDLGSKLLIVATDRLSAFDVVMAEPIPGKGQVLTSISAYWFEALKDIGSNHVISLDPDEFPPECRPYASELAGRSMLVKKAAPLAIECIVRGYLAGSGYKDYLDNGQVCGYKLPPGLREAARLEKPLFTPSTKAELGAHDENITMDQAREIVGPDLADEAARLSLALYEKARSLAEAKGIIVADTKFEFGLYEGELILIDEALTPDSSRFWPLDQYEPGRSQPSFDKQFVRDYLSTLDWDKTPPPPRLPQEIIERTAEKYQEALRLLTGWALA